MMSTSWRPYYPIPGYTPMDSEDVLSGIQRPPTLAEIEARGAARARAEQRAAQDRAPYIRPITGRPTMSTPVRLDPRVMQAALQGVRGATAQPRQRRPSGGGGPSRADIARALRLIARNADRIDDMADAMAAQYKPHRYGSPASMQGVYDGDARSFIGVSGNPYYGGWAASDIVTLADNAAANSQVSNTWTGDDRARLNDVPIVGLLLVAFPAVGSGYWSQAGAAALEIEASLNGVPLQSLRDVPGIVVFANADRRPFAVPLAGPDGDPLIVTPGSGFSVTYTARVAGAGGVGDSTSFQAIAIAATT